MVKIPQNDRLYDCRDKNLVSAKSLAHDCFSLLKPNSITLAVSELVRSWFGAGSKLVRAEIWPIIQLANSELARASRFAAKFHYAIWFEAGSELVRRWFEPDSVMELASNKLRTSSEPAIVMEFGFKSPSIQQGCQSTCHIINSSHETS